MFQDRRVLVVMNPASGKARPEAARSSVAAALETAGAEAEIRSTTDRDTARRWASRAAHEGFDFILAAGGDGTVTAVASGVLRSDRPLPVGIVPLGTGNGLARVLRIPMDAARAVRALDGGRIVPLDIVDVHSPPSISLFFLGAGLDAEINRDADPLSKARFGFLAYVGATARNLFGRRLHRIDLTVDGRRERLAAHTITVFNAGPVEVAGFGVGPDVDAHDGYVDLTVLRSGGFWRSLAGVLRIAAGQPDAESRRVRRFRVDARPPLLVHVDGDVVGSTPLDAEVVPGGVEFIAASDYRGGLPVARGAR